MVNKLIENINIMYIFVEIWNIFRCFVGSASEYSQDQEFAPGSKKKNTIACNSVFIVDYFKTEIKYLDTVIPHFPV